MALRTGDSWAWGGGSHDHYTAWGDLAEWLHLPLLVTEVGVDSSAYATHAWDSYDYGLREARMIQELLTSARPQARTRSREPQGPRRT